MRDRIERMIEQTMNTCLSWVVSKDGAVLFEDPLDHVEISAHYGNTHMAASLIIYGTIKNSNTYIEKGEALLNSILDRWNENKILPGFHNDFNNFALCVIDSFTPKYHDRIKACVMETEDTAFDTINWLPMRWFVNKCRYEWTKDKAYQDICDKCKSMIKSATYSDGYIEDMLPLGTSFSLQYNVATVAFMQYLRVMGEELDLGLQTGALLNSVMPDGDINYFGRGTNQVFAWGLWIYLLSSGNLNGLDTALTYLEKHLTDMLSNNNMMLNDFDGKDKYMWWDYHYCSVYTAHLLFWLVLSLKDYGKKDIEPKLVTDGSSGVHVLRNDDAFVVTFDGRDNYLAEKGPAIEAVWSKKSGAILKGAFGPWYGLFGNDHLMADATIRNFMGLFTLKSENDGGVNNPLIKKLQSKIRKDPEETIKPLFLSPSVDITDKIRITYKLEGLPMLINIPYYSGDISVIADGERLNLVDTMKLRTQYGWINIKQQRIESAKELIIEIS